MEKPDFEHLAKDFSYTHALVDSDDHVTALLAYRAGCEHVWNTHVVPLQETEKALRKLVCDVDDENRLIKADNKLLREEIERLKSSQRFAISESIQLREENQRLKTELNSKCNNMM